MKTQNALRTINPTPIRSPGSTSKTLLPGKFAPEPSPTSIHHLVNPMSETLPPSCDNRLNTNIWTNKMQRSNINLNLQLLITHLAPWSRNPLTETLKRNLPILIASCNPWPLTPTLNPRTCAREIITSNGSGLRFTRARWGRRLQPLWFRGWVLIQTKGLGAFGKWNIKYKYQFNMATIPILLTSLSHLSKPHQNLLHFSLPGNTHFSENESPNPLDSFLALVSLLIHLLFSAVASKAESRLSSKTRSLKRLNLNFPMPRPSPHSRFGSVIDTQPWRPPTNLRHKILFKPRWPAYFGKQCSVACNASRWIANALNYNLTPTPWNAKPNEVPKRHLKH